MPDNSKANPAVSTPDKFEKSSLINQWGGSFALFFSFTHFSHDLTNGMLPALLPFIRQDLNLDYLQAGFLVSAFALTSGLSQLLGGWLSDRMSKRNAITLGLGGVGLSSIAVGLTHSYYLMIAAFIALGIFYGFYHPSAVSGLTTHFEEKRRGRVVALHYLGGSIGFALGPLLGAIIAAKLNWHLAYVVLSVPALAAALLAFWRLTLTPFKSVSIVTTTTPAEEKAKPGLWQVFKPVAAIVAISVGMQLFTGPVVSFAALFLTDVHQLSVTASSLWVTIIRFGSLLGNIIGGWLTDKWGRWNTVFLLLIVFGPVVFLLAWAPSGFALIAAFILFGLIMTMRETVMQTLLMDTAPPQLRATVFGIYFGFGAQGSSILQPVAGDLMDAIGISAIYNAMAYISVALSLAAVLLFINRRKSAKNAENSQL
jgi:FSR family fosmidomycin resistance protein-like MFS transporter